MVISPIIAIYMYILTLISPCINVFQTVHGDHITSDISYLIAKHINIHYDNH